MIEESWEKIGIFALGWLNFASSVKYGTQKLMG